MCNFGGYRLIYSDENIYIEGETNEVLVNDVSFAQTSYNLVKNSTFQLEPTIKPDNATNKNLIYTSSDESVLTVDNDGLITCIADGSSTITVKIDSITKELEVTVGQLYVDGDTIYKDTLYDAVSSFYLTNSGTYTIHLANDEEILAEVYVIDGNTTYTSTPTLCDNVTDTKMCIYKYKGDLTINNGLS